MYSEGMGRWALEYNQNEGKEEPKTTVIKTFDDINQYQLRLIDDYPETVVDRWTLEHNKVDEIDTYKLLYSEVRVDNSSKPNPVFIVLLVIIFALLLFTLFYSFK